MTRILNHLIYILPILILQASTWSLNRGMLMGHNIIDDFAPFIFLEYVLGAGFVAIEAIILVLAARAYFVTLNYENDVKMKVINRILIYSIIFLLISLPIISIPSILAVQYGEGITDLPASSIWLVPWIFISMAPIPVATITAGISVEVLHSHNQSSVRFEEAYQKYGWDPEKISQVTGLALMDVEAKLKEAYEENITASLNGSS